MAQPSDLMRDLAQKSRAAQRLDKERAEQFAAMVRSEGWKLYVALLEAQIQLRGDAVLAPARSADGAIALEYVKGAMSGLILARDLPEVIMADMKSALEGGESDEDS